MLRDPHPESRDSIRQFERLLLNGIEFWLEYARPVPIGLYYLPYHLVVPIRPEPSLTVTKRIF